MSFVHRFHRITQRYFGYFHLEEARCRAVGFAALNIPVVAIDARRRAGRSRAARSIDRKLKRAGVRIAIVDLTIDLRPYGTMTARP